MAVMAASPSPRAAARSRLHPTYKEMIVSAIESLKERTGSSKPAIAKYILSNYSDLPPKHDALLAHHLRRLKTGGLLSMVNHSYKLSPSAAAADRSSNPSAKKPRGHPSKLGRPPKNLLAGTDPVWPSKAKPLDEKRRPGRPKKVSPGLVSLGSPGVLDSKKRKPGRPRKSSLAVELFFPKDMNPVLDSTPVDLIPSTEKRKPGRPPKAKSLSEKRKPGRPKVVSVASVHLGSTGVLDSKKRKPGRPRNDPSASLPVELILPMGMKMVVDPKPASLIPSGEKRNPGRLRKGKPLSEKRKPGQVSAALVALGSPSGVLDSKKRNPGRPRKDQSASLSTVLILPKDLTPVLDPKLAALTSSGKKRKRGWPKKGSIPISSINVEVGGGGDGGSTPKTVLPLPESTVREVSAAVDIPVASVTASVEKRGRGRPPKKSNSVALAVKVGSEKKRPVGRLRKNVAV